MDDNIDLYSSIVFTYHGLGEDLPSHTVFYLSFCMKKEKVQFVKSNGSILIPSYTTGLFSKPIQEKIKPSGTDMS